MGEEILIYHQIVVDTYLYFIKESLSLIRKIFNEIGPPEPYDPTQKERLFTGRAKHLQIMTLIGLTAEHIIKIILLKRGFVLNTSDENAKFQDAFMHELEQKNTTNLTQTDIDSLYVKAKNLVNIEFNKNLIQFDKCISLFNNSNPPNYFDNVRTYELNPYPEKYDGDSYLGYKQIMPAETLRVIQRMRNSYLHLAEAQSEQHGVVWYLFNFLVWLCQKEYPTFYQNEAMIGTDNAKGLFANETPE